MVKAEETKEVESVFLKMLRDPNRFKKLDDGWIRDSLLGVEWGPSSEKDMNFSNAKKYCDKLGGRLPEVNELQSLVDYRNDDPCINRDIFPDTKSSWYWTATPCAWDAIAVWVVVFYGGLVSCLSKGYGSFVRPVRASQ